MNLFGKKVSAIWAFIGPAVVFLLMFFFGQGIYWQSKSANIQNINAVIELREKMNSTLEEIMKTEPKSPLFNRKVDLFNAAEKALAELEGRQPVFYKIPPPAAPQNLRLQ